MPQKGWFGFTPGTDLPQLILTSLEESPKVVQELRNDIRGLSRIWLEPGALSRTLRHLEYCGWIELQESEKKSRHVYRLTHTGRLALRQRSVAFFENRERVRPQPFVDLHKERILMIILTWILHLYPRAWRERYEPEMLALLEEHSITFFTGLDLLVGALDARIDPYYRRLGALSAHQRFQRTRTATTVAFGALPLVLLSSLFIDAHMNSAWWFQWSETHFFFISLMDRVSEFGSFLWGVALLVALALVAYHGIKSGKRKDRVLSVLSFGSVVITLFGFFGPFGPSLLLSLSLGLLGTSGMIALAVVGGNSSERILRCFLVLGALLTAGVLLDCGIMGIAEVVMSILWSGSNWFLPLPGGILSLLGMGVTIWLLVRGFGALRTPQAPSDSHAEMLPPQYIQQEQTR